MDEAGPRPTSGHLYAITHPRYPACTKIGKARDPARRLAAANTWSPHGRFGLAGTVFFDNCDRAEKAAHALLKAVRLRGEWFRVSPAEALSILRGLRRRERNRDNP